MSIESIKQDTANTEMELMKEEAVFVSRADHWTLMARASGWSARSIKYKSILLALEKAFRDLPNDNTFGCVLADLIKEEMEKVDKYGR